MRQSISVVSQTSHSSLGAAVFEVALAIQLRRRHRLSVRIYFGELLPAVAADIVGLTSPEAKGLSLRLALRLELTVPWVEVRPCDPQLALSALRMVSPPAPY